MTTPMMLTFSLLGAALLGAGNAEAASPPATRGSPSPDSSSLHDNLLGTFNAHFFPERLPGGVESDPRAHEAEHEGEGARGACLTGLVAALKENWDLFTPDEKAEITNKLAPFKSDLMDPIVFPAEVSEGGMAPPAAPCFGYYYDNHLDSDHFSITWEDGSLTDTQAENFLESLEFSWDVEIDELGWLQPAGVSSDPMMIIVEAGGYAGASTTVDQCPDGSYVPYIVAYEGSFFDSSWYKVMACHEFNHASQFSYGYGHEFWWWEASATYMEEQVYPAINDWSNMAWGYTNHPELGMNSFDVRSNSDNLFWHTYGMVVWAFYLDEHVGGSDFIRSTWTEARGRGTGYDLWLPNIIEDVGEDFDEVYLGFMATNAVMDYAEGSYMPNLRDVNVNELPIEDEEPSDSSRPQSLGQAYIRFDGDLGEEGELLQVTLDGNNEAEWYAVLVRGKNTADEVVVFELNDEGEGVASIAFDGSRDITLVISPKNEDDQGYRHRWDTDEGYNFYYSAEVVTAESDGGGDGDTGSDTGDPTVGDGDDGGGKGGGKGGKGGGCACSTASQGAALSAWLSGLLLLGLRRRNQAKA